MVGVLLMILGVIVFSVVVVLWYNNTTQRKLVSIDELCKNALSQIAV